MIDPAAFHRAAGRIRAGVRRGLSPRRDRGLRGFICDTSGASLVEYAVALIVVTIVGGVIFAFGDNVAAIIDASAGAF